MEKNDEDFDAYQSGNYSYEGGQELESVTWTASEFVQNEKTTQWFILLGVSAAVIGVIVYFASGVLSSIVVVLALLVLGIVGARTPRTLTYTLDENGLKIGNKSYMYDDFRSFSIIDEGAIDSIQLTPMKRMMPPISIYFAPDDGEKIVGVLTQVLPHEDRKRDSVDRFMSRLHF